MSKKSEFSYEALNVSPSSIAKFRDKYYEIEYQPKVVYKNASRYKNLRTIVDEDTNKVYHESWNQQVIKISKEDQYFTVTKYEEDRLDVISMQYYGTPRFWWIIAMANYIIDPFSVPAGTILRIPTKQSLYLSGGVLSG